jgi:hypothetical protein
VGSLSGSSLVDARTSGVTDTDGVAEADDDCEMVAELDGI